MTVRAGSEPAEVREAAAGQHAIVDRGRLRSLLVEEEARFRREHPRSGELWERSQRMLLGGVPMPWMDSIFVQSGCAMMPTRKPSPSSTRPIIAAPNDGWSTYASPVMMSTSSSAQPRATISARVVGRKAVRSGD